MTVTKAETGLSVYAIKIIFIIVTILECFICGMIPIKCKAFNESPKFLNVANSFSGGVFLTIACVHIMPEMSEKWDEVNKAWNKNK